MGERILRFQGDASTEIIRSLVLLIVFIANVSTSRKCNRLKSLTFSASLETNTLLT